MLLSNLIVAGISFAYWSGVINPPTSQSSTININAGQGFTQTLSLNSEYWGPYPPKDNELLMPNGTLAYAYDTTNSKEEVFDDFRISVPAPNGVTTNLIMEVKSLTFTPKPHITSPQDYSAYHHYIYAKVQIGNREVTTENPYTALHTATFSGNNLGLTKYALTPGAAALYVRVTFYIEGAPNFTDPVFYNAIKESQITGQIELRLEDPNVSGGPVWKQYNVSGTSTTFTRIKNLGLYAEGTLPAYDPNHYYYVGDMFIDTDSTSPHYNQIFLVTEEGIINLNDPQSLKFVQGTKEYKPFHSYRRGDVVLYDNNGTIEAYVWNVSNRDHKPYDNNSFEPTIDTAWVLISGGATANYWSRYYYYELGDVVKLYQNGQTYVSRKDFNIAPNLNYDISTAIDDWVRDNTVSNCTIFNAATTYNKGDYTHIINGGVKEYYMAVTTVTGLSPDVRPELWKKVILN